MHYKRGIWASRVVVPGADGAFCCFPGQLGIRLEELEDEGLLVSWAFRDTPVLDLKVAPKFQLHDVSQLPWHGGDARGGVGGLSSHLGCCTPRILP